MTWVWRGVGVGVADRDGLNRHPAPPPPAGDWEASSAMILSPGSASHQAVQRDGIRPDLGNPSFFIPPPNPNTLPGNFLHHFLLSDSVIRT